MKIAVYCASSNQIHEKYQQAAREFAQAACLRDYTILCGGVDLGLMKTLCDEVTAAGGNVVGVIPHFMCEKGLHSTNLTETVYVHTMADRKAYLRAEADAVVAFPGSIGTVDEFIEVLVLKKLKQFDGKVILYNYEGFWNPFIEMLNHFVKESVFDKADFDKMIIAETLDQLLEALEK